MSKFVIDEAFLQQLETLQMLVKNNIAGLFGGNHQTKTYGSSCEFADLRDYIAGDDITKIDWNAYARFEKLYLKLYFDERQTHTKIYLDASRSMAFGKGKKDEQALKIAAALACLSVSAMDKVSLYVVRDNEVSEVFANLLGRDAFVSALGKFNEIEFYGDSYISEALLREKVGYGDGMSVIVSDFLTDNNYEDAIDYLVEKKRDVFCMQILSKEELNPKVRGKVHFFDSENSSRFYRKDINREIVKAYRQALEYATSRVREFCFSRGAEYLLVPSEESVVEVFFGKMADMGVVK